MQSVFTSYFPPTAVTGATKRVREDDRAAEDDEGTRLVYSRQRERHPEEQCCDAH